MKVIFFILFLGEGMSLSIPPSVQGSIISKSASNQRRLFQTSQRVLPHRVPATIQRVRNSQPVLANQRIAHRTLQSNTRTPTSAHINNTHKPATIQRIQTSLHRTPIQNNNQRNNIRTLHQRRVFNSRIPNRQRPVAKLAQHPATLQRSMFSQKPTVRYQTMQMKSSSLPSSPLSNHHVNRGRKTSVAKLLRLPRRVRRQVYPRRLRSVSPSQNPSITFRSLKNNHGILI